MQLEISIHKILAMPLVWLTKNLNDNKVIVVCKGYCDDWDYYTGLYWNDDKDADFNNYQNYQLWLKI